MRLAIQRLSLGFGLILLAAAILLLSDLDRRRPGASDIPEIAIMQQQSQAQLDDGVTGILEGLARAGFEDGRTISIRRYNAEGDAATANTIAREITSGSFDLVVTVTTLSLQAVANANREGRTRHVFALVSDPFGAGVGISRENPLEHPPYMTGYGSMNPVAKTFDTAKRSFPALSRVGVAWNPGESNSEANVRLARTVCRDLGIELVEANAENTSAVAEAVRSLVGRGVEALWVGADVTAMTAVDVILEAARNARIPVFTSMSGIAPRGGLFDIGPDFREVGHFAGDLAARILRGADPATIPVENLMPEKIAVNEAALTGLRQPWKIPDDILAAARSPAPEGRASVYAAKTPAAPARQWKIDLLEYISSVDVDEAIRGIRQGLVDSGFAEGRDHAIRIRSANGDMPTLSALVDAALVDGADMLVTFSSPTLQAAVQRARKVPIVFTYVANPMAAGAGVSATEHLPNVTGVSTLGPYEEILSLVREVLPTARRLGTLFVPAEVNSVYNKDRLVELGKPMGFEIVTVPVNASSEVSDATLSLLSQKLDAICQVGANMTNTAFASIALPARQARMPVFAALTSNLEEGAVAVIARDYYDGGHQAGRMAARILRGASPASIPFESLASAHLMVNLDAARAAGVRIPKSVVERATRVIGQ